MLIFLSFALGVNCPQMGSKNLCPPASFLLYFHIGFRSASECFAFLTLLRCKLGHLLGLKFLKGKAAKLWAKNDWNNKSPKYLVSIIIMGNGKEKHNFLHQLF